MIGKFFVHTVLILMTRNVQIGYKDKYYLYIYIYMYYTNSRIIVVKSISIHNTIKTFLWMFTSNIYHSTTTYK